MSKETLRDRLRASTRPAHDDLERAVDIDTRIATREGYAGHLLRLWALHSSIEAALARLDFAALGFLYRGPHRSGLLETDLEIIGIPPAALSALPLPAAPEIASIFDGLGCLYVVEGSAKGARAILPQIKARLGFEPHFGASYFYGFGAETGRLWHAILAAINAIDPQSNEADRAVTAAAATFAMFHAWLDPARQDEAETDLVRDRGNRLSMVSPSPNPLERATSAGAVTP